MTECRLPVVGEYMRGLGTLVEIQDVTPQPPPKEEDYIFRTIHATWQVRLGPETLKEAGTYNEFYGVGTAVKSALEEAKNYAAKHNIGPDSQIEVVAIRITTHGRYCPVNRENPYARELRDFESLKCGSRWNIPPDTREVVWTSRTPVIIGSQPPEAKGK